MIKNILNLGDSAVYCDFGPEVNKETNRKVINYFKFLKEKNIDGVLNLTPSYNKLIITFDLDKTSFQKLKDLLITIKICLLYTSPSPRDGLLSRMPSSA